MEDLDLLLMAAAASVTTTGTNGTAVDMGKGVAGWAPPEGGLPVQCLIPVTAIDRTTGDETYSFKLQDSADNSTFTDISATRATSDYSAVANTTGAGGNVYVGGFCRQRYVRLVRTLGGTTPIISHGNVYLQPLVPHMG